MAARLGYDDRKRLIQFGIGAAVLAWVLLDAAGGGSSWNRVWHRMPMLLTGSGEGSSLAGGFALNVILSIVSMALATVMGTVLGLALLAKSALVRRPAFFVMNFLRNSPWLVLLFLMLYALPFNVMVFGTSVAIPPAAKAVIGLSLPTAANFAEIIRGGVQSIPSGQWEAARSLGYTTLQIYRQIVLAQALPRMVPGWMNLYALLTIATSLATVTGVQDVLTVLNTVLSMESERTLVYFYLATLFLFFAYCFPISLLARRLEGMTKGDVI